MLHGQIDNFENNYIFIDYESVNAKKIVDSVLVKNKQFEFRGILAEPTSIIFTSNGLSASSREIYLDNSEVNVNLSFQRKKLPSGTFIDFFVVNETHGSKTDAVFKAFVKFSSENSNTSTWNSELYKRLEAIFIENPDNILSGGLLFDASRDTVLDNAQLKKLYALINWENQDVIRNARVREHIFPEENLSTGNAIKDFSLSDEKGQSISTLDFRRLFLLIDFWASWCVPCREKFPALKKVYKAYNQRQFEILGVSIDESKERWVNALEKDSLPWTNVITKGGPKSEVPMTYKVFGVPTNFLIDKEGTIVARDLSPEQLSSWLENNAL